MKLTLERFKAAHAESYGTALREIQAGKKESHWIWYIFPQIAGLGRSAVAQYYEIQDEAEAMAFWQDPLLSGHLTEITKALLNLENSIDSILGFPDNLKLRSSMTLFYLVTGEPLFKKVLDKFFAGETDEYTVRKVSRERKGYETN